MADLAANVRRRTYRAAVPVPDFQTVMRPTLIALGDGSPHTLQQIRQAVASALDVSEADQQQLLPSG